MLVKVTSKPWYTSKTAAGSFACFAFIALAYVGFILNIKPLTAIGLVGGLSASMLSLSSRTHPQLPIHFFRGFDVYVRIEDEPNPDVRAIPIVDDEDPYIGPLDWILKRRAEGHWPWGPRKTYNPPMVCPSCGVKVGTYNS